MTRRLFALTLVSSLLSACQLGGGTEQFVPPASCTPIQGACETNSDCCSYGCMSGICTPNPVPGGICRTSDDCGVVMDATGFHYMGCKSGACTTDVVCRDDADVCDSDNDCCSGNCVGASWGTSGQCKPNSAPVVDLGADREIPYSRTAALTATVSDPDATDTLVYGWTLVAAPPGSTATISNPTAASPTFVPNVPGAYHLRLVVTDGPTTQRSRLQGSDEVTLVAVNHPPLADPGAGSSHASRNVLQPLVAQVSDPDLDPLTCTWKISSPGHAEEIRRGPEACAGTFASDFTPDLEETWTATLVVTDGVNTTTVSAAYACVNDPPVASAGPARAGNLGGGPVPIQGSATDVNGDTAFEYLWSFDQVPAGSKVTDTPLPATAAVSFTPDVLGQYVLRLRVSDRPGSYTESTVDVQVDRRVIAVHDVRVAAYAKTANRLVVAGQDPDDSTKGRVSVLDPATGNAVAYAQLSGVPTSIDTNADATLIAAGGPAALWWVTVSGTTATPNVITQVPFSINDVVAVDARRIFLLPATSGSYVYAFDTQNAAQGPVQTAARGTKASLDPSTRNALFVWDPGWGELRRYAVNSTGQGSSSLGATSVYAPTSGVSDLWVSQNGDALFLSSGAIRSTMTLAALAESLGFSPGLVDSSADGRIVAVGSGASQLRLFSSVYAPAGTDLLPLWGFDGNRNQTTARHAFLSSDGNTRYAIVSAAGRYGLVTFP
ncbi:PKD domain-containing protein [Anaeromyxobacter sp. Fw109-5]|uniref:PKD domain-containing protein n=1 Tax=Anaeromyxobacter sp. (strain Fw109-5) TaxID=404589 RepID=UPI000158A5FB|nr:PKD domain-containing protein [Anaeromyxobacter sp. Fw109-5]ABS27636.1 hypothetical protein Anae109_3452 [Anaeromyxobacter sp. Fw109-5]